MYAALNKKPSAPCLQPMPLNDLIAGIRNGTIVGRPSVDPDDDDRHYISNTSFVLAKHLELAKKEVAATAKIRAFNEMYKAELRRIEDTLIFQGVDEVETIIANFNKLISK
jgi:hypothetical protein